jgi:colanic acid/amylovoran biosynthesis glycosyltransferase
VKILYITTMLPFGTKEAFFIPELQELIRCGHEVTILPMRKPGGIVHADAQELAKITVFAPLFGPRVGWAFAQELVIHPVRTIAAATRLLKRSGSLRALTKNLAVFPKGVWAARAARRLEIGHIHAQWAGATASMGWVASAISAVPFSFTAHRWDIPENNALALKAEAARLIRAIDAHGAAELAAFVRPNEHKIQVIHMGVALQDLRRGSVTARKVFRIVVAANLVEKKGHAFLIRTARMLIDRGVPLAVDFVGDGPLRDALRRQVALAGLDSVICFAGVLPHDELLRRLCDGHWDVMALPSIVTATGEKEGIPVSLIEAMACGVPVISTDTGGIPELLGGGVGVLVPEQDLTAMAQGLEGLYTDVGRRQALAKAGAQRVAEQFAVAAVMRRFTSAISTE